MIVLSAFFKKSSVEKPEIDYALFWVVMILLMFGLVMVYSSSIAMADGSKETHFRPTFFLVRHSIFVAVSIIAGIIAYQIPIEKWQKMSPYLFLLGTFLLIVVLIPGLGKEVNGSRRWIPLFIINFQPSELVKFFTVLYAADYTVRKASYMDSFRHGFLPMLIVMLFVGSLLLVEPDFGAFTVVACIAIANLFIGGLHWKQFAGLLGLLVVGFLTMILSSEYRMKRILGFLDPWSDPYGKGYQLSHALIAFGRGDFLGVGLGGSVEKLFYLPEAHTDFLLAVVGEELGFLGVLCVIIAFMWIVYRAFAIGTEAYNQHKIFTSLVAKGMGVWIGVQSIINMGVNVGLLPTKGLTLPFLSFGGSGLVVNCVTIAVLLRIDYENKMTAYEQKKTILNSV